MRRVWTPTLVDQARTILYERGACSQPGRWQPELDQHLHQAWLDYLAERTTKAEMARSRDPHKVATIAAGEPFDRAGWTLPRAMTTDEPEARRTDRQAVRDRAAIGFAKEVCATCPVAALCLELAITQGETGVWGGRTDRDRDDLRALRAG